MSAKTDVLALMDGLARDWRDNGLIVSRADSADAIEKARAAVAELVVFVDEIGRGVWVKDPKVCQMVAKDLLTKFGEQQSG